MHYDLPIKVSDKLFNFDNFILTPKPKMFFSMQFIAAKFIELIFIKYFFLLEADFSFKHKQKFNNLLYKNFNPNRFDK